MTEPPQQPGPRSDETPTGAVETFEDLLAAALECLDTEGPAGVERFFAAFPTHAPRLRSHIERLQRIGLGGDPTTESQVQPERLGEFKILSVLRHGAMGVVYRAVQESLGREVALKVVRPDLLFFPGARERFRREVELVARMQHPGIVPIYSVGNASGVPYFAMELVRGATLADVITLLHDVPPARLDGAAIDEAIARQIGDEERREPAVLFVGTWVQAVLRILREVAEALEHMHRRGVLHRDVKPSNIMLTRDGRVLLLDFGLAGVDGGERLTRTGSPLGSLAYMPPELISDEPGPREACSDVYSLGVTGWEMLTMQLPYQSSDPVRMRELARAATRPRLTTLNPGVSWQVETVIATAMDPDPARRYSSAARFSRDLDNLLARRPIEAEEPSAWLRARRLVQRHPARATAVIAAFLLCCVAPTVFLFQQRAASRSIRLALAKARIERDRAREAVEVLLTRVATEDLLSTPRLQHVRRDLLASARSFYERFLQETSDDDALLEDAAYAAVQLAVLEAELGRPAAGVDAVTRAVQLARQLAGRSAAGSRRLADALHEQGKVQHVLARSDESVASLDEAQTILRIALDTDSEDPSVATDLLAVERTRALVFANLGDEAREQGCYRAIAELWQKLAEPVRDTAAWRDAFDHVLCATADEAQKHLRGGRRDAARDALSRGERLSQSVSSATAPARCRVAIARLHLTAGRLHAYDNQLEDAEAKFRASLTVVAPVLEDNPDHANALRLEADALNSLSLLLSRSPSRRVEARELLVASIDRLRRQVALDPNVVDNRANLAISLYNLGARQQDDGELRDALATFGEARELLDAAMAAAPTRFDWGRHRYNVTWFIGQVTGALGDAAATLDAARTLASMQPDDARTQRIAAGLCATAAAALAAAPTATSDGAAQARRVAEALGLELLRRAADLGCTDFEWLRSGAEFEPLRSLDGYAAILADVERNVARANGTADDK